MRAISTVRGLLARHRWMYWLLITVLTIVVISSALEPGRRAEREQARWGTTTPVVIVTRAVAAGQDVEAVEIRDYPLAVVPDDHLNPAAIGEAPMVARHPLGSGQVLTRAAITDHRSPIALARPGDVIAAVTTTTATTGLGLIAGDRVMVASDGIVIVDEALVVAVDADSVLLSVPTPLGALVTAAESSLGGVALLLIP